MTRQFYFKDRYVRYEACALASLTTNYVNKLVNELVPDGKVVYYHEEGEFNFFVH